MLNSSARSHPAASGQEPADAPKPASPNAERNAEIIRRRLAGEWPADIAEALDLTRNAVIGVCNRAGLAERNRENRAVARARERRRGAGPRHRKLSASEIATIQALYRGRGGPTQEAIAQRFGVTPQTISRALRRTP
jgi:transcriptional regulator with XRE-family HTH domain